MLKNQTPTKTTQKEKHSQKNDSILKIKNILKTTTWALVIPIIIYGILPPLTGSIIDKSTSDFLSTILVIAISLLTIVYMILVAKIHRESTPKLKFTQASLKYAILPTCVATILISNLNAKFFSDYPSFASSILAILGAIFSTESERSPSSIQKDRKNRTAKSIKNLTSKSHHLRVEAIQDLALIADEWLGDDFAGESVSKIHAQNILDQFCALIRSGFPLIKEYPNNKASKIPQEKEQKIQQEQEVRRLIFAEMSRRLSKVDQEGNITPGPWSKFNLDFSWAPIFYKMNELTLEQLDFNKLEFCRDIDFSQSTFITPITCSRYFKTNVTFKGAKFCSDICFTNAFFYGLTDFSNTAFYGEADFESTHFGDSSLNEPKTSKYWEEIFEQFIVKDIEPLNIPDGTLQAAPANFKNAVFYKEAIFYGAKFHKDAHFECTKFKDVADFTAALFKGQPCFDKAIFDSKAIFLDVHPKSEIYFKRTMFNENESKKNKFLSHTDPQNIKTGIVPTDSSHNWPSEHIPIDSCYFKNFSDCEESKIYYCSAPATSAPATSAPATSAPATSAPAKRLFLPMIPLKFSSKVFFLKY